LPHRLGDTDVIPDQLVSGAQGLTIQELERRRVIPAGGQIGLTVPESFGQRVNPGINRIALGNGITFDTMVFNTTLSWQTASPGVVGCGLVFDGVSDTENNLAYIDQTGGYGLSERLDESFSPGIFGVNPDWTEGKQNLLVIRLKDKVHYYVNRHYVGTMDLAPSTGEIGIAVVNYETIDTTCQFDDTWIWRLASP
ncbi:MAG TPA: hypothetical protein VHL11_05970, partial [Phototrophicaceae bacterium]|nr:hypothetical protein [Phototrophicaceae bacterium]